MSTDLSRGTALLTAVLTLMAIVFASGISATGADPADRSIKQFLAKGDTPHAYRAVRRLEARNGSRTGWLDAVTEYSPQTGFRYQVTAEGGSSYIRSEVLKKLLDEEREVIEHGKTSRASLGPANYNFQPNGIDADGLVNVLLEPRRKEHVLIAGAMSLNATDGALVRLKGRLAKSPSRWVTDVEIERTYARINGVVLPVTLETKAQVRLLGEATLRMTYAYSEIDGRTLVASR